MNAIGITTAITLVSQLIGEAYKLNQIIVNARAEDRDITKEEWSTLDIAQKDAHDDLLASIERREVDEVSGD